MLYKVWLGEDLVGIWAHEPTARRIMEIMDCIAGDARIESIDMEIQW